MTAAAAEPRRKVRRDGSSEVAHLVGEAAALFAARGIERGPSWIARQVHAYLRRPTLSAAMAFEPYILGRAAAVNAARGARMVARRGKSRSLYVQWLDPVFDAASRHLDARDAR